MTKHDRDALKLALEQARAADADHDEQIRFLMREGGWQEAAIFTQYHCQTRALRLSLGKNRPAAPMKMIPVNATRTHTSCCGKCWRSASRAGIPTRWRR